MLSGLWQFLKKESVLSLSFLLAVLSAMVVPLDWHYFDAIDFKTLCLLFCLMLVIEGLREEAFFQYIGNAILKHIRTKRGLVYALVFLPFIGSMMMTNDVALITFVPFALLILRMVNFSSQMSDIVVLMTIAANLGSMFTPIGNPQNLYLFSLSELSLLEFLWLMLPYTIGSALLLMLCIQFKFKSEKLTLEKQQEHSMNIRLISIFLILFLCCLLTVARIFSPVLLFFIIVISIAILKRSLFLRIDYSLLLTFLFFFLFVGNLKQIEYFERVMTQWVVGHERVVSIILSQVISNVPAAMLLSAYTDQIKEIIVGSNLGGLGTLIASMASLISYKQIAVLYPHRKGEYLRIFTRLNLVFLVVLYGIGRLL